MHLKFNKDTLREKYYLMLPTSLHKSKFVKNAVKKDKNLLINQILINRN